MSTTISTKISTFFNYFTQYSKRNSGVGLKIGDKLKGLLIDCKAKGYLTNEFAIEASLIACICIAKKDRTYCHNIKEEALSHFNYKLVRKWEMLDETKSPISYLNQMAYTSLLDVSGREQRYQDKKKDCLMIVKTRLNIQDS